MIIVFNFSCVFWIIKLIQMNFIILIYFIIILVDINLFLAQKVFYLFLYAYIDFRLNKRIR